ncbi:thermonuclease [Roseibacterium elongatum DSM 19469]|uniref:Thermonuclease n=1 Tax=Roseicyclus elongatus DSM 19469 TaxID=1294273 RepID=W8S9J7_9RHOB|nr:thermonuclease [Roseibacterium elongatum DSM 19469]
MVDGDTVDMVCPDEGRFRARLTGYDTPESFAPRCAEEAQRAHQATARLRALVRSAVRVEARLGGVDRYNRRLVHLRLDGVDVGATLISEGLAVRYAGGRRIDWCARMG